MWTQSLGSNKSHYHLVAASSSSKQERHERSSLSRIRVAELFAVPGVVRHRARREVKNHAPREDVGRARPAGDGKPGPLDDLACGNRPVTHQADVASMACAVA